MDNGILKDKTALVTGASSGLGVDFARDLAARGCNLVLVARRENLLRQVQADLGKQYAVDVQIVTMDLSTPDAPQALYDQLKAAGKQIDVLINNAGYGVYGQFVDIPWEREKNMIDLDIITLVAITKLFVKDMVARNFGYIMQVSSNGAFQPTPTYAVYSAAKSFVLSFGEALNYELRQTNVRCTTICPGVTATEFLKVSGQKATPYQRMTRMDSPTVTRIGINAMLRGRSSVVPGVINAIMAWSTRFMPRPMSAAVAYRAMVNH